MSSSEFETTDVKIETPRFIKHEYNSDSSSSESENKDAISKKPRIVKLEYNSDGSINYSESTNVKTRKPRALKVWEKKLEFASPKEAEDFVRSQEMWKKCTSYKGLEGVKVTYRCSLGAYRRKECTAGIYLLYHSDSRKVSLYEAPNHSNHTDDRRRGLKLKTRQIIQEMFRSGIVKPNTILAAFRKRNLEEPNILKLKNYLATLRSKKVCQPTISVAQLLEWCRENSAVPSEDSNQPFVLSYKAISQANQDLGIVLSTKCLLQSACKSHLVQTDTTHKLIWQGYSILIVGTSDSNKDFHPFALAVCDGEKDTDFEFIFNAIKHSCLDLFQTTWTPTILLADASDAVTNGFNLVFDVPYIRLQCYFHMIKSVDSKLRTLESKEFIRRDIEVLHFCADDETFDAACGLFFNKWYSNNHELINEFLSYFETCWLGDNRYWYEGASLMYPSTNNELASIISQIKKENIFRERLPQNDFLDVIESMLKKWSNDRDRQNPSHKPFVLKPHVSKETWTETYQWLKSKPNIFEETTPQEDKLFYVLSSSIEQEELNEEFIQSYNSKNLIWPSFHEYVSYSTVLWKVKWVKLNETFQTICNCPTYAKISVCKHNLGLLVLQGVEKVPLEAKSERKRKSSRPCKRESQ